MKHLISTVFVATVVATTVTTNVFAKDKQRKSPHETVKNDNISITYGRPSKNGREIFGSLVPYGEVWRTGADEATEITFSKDVKVAGMPVKAGTYTLFTVPNKDQWDIILNTKLKQWGAFSYDKTNDVLHTSVKSKNSDKVAEQFTISITGSGLNLAWDKTSVFIPVQ
jgi:Protein of unknown function (DUF2911)